MPYSFALSASMANIYIVFLLKLSVSLHLKSRQGFIAEACLASVALFHSTFLHSEEEH